MDKGQKKAKHERKRAEKRKHERETEEMWEEASRRKFKKREEAGAIIMVVVFGVFMVFGVILWQPGNEAEKGNTGLSDGAYDAIYLESRPASDGSPAVAAIEVNRDVYLIYEQDLSGNARENAASFFEIPDDQEIGITVEDGYITDWTEK